MEVERYQRFGYLLPPKSVSMSNSCTLVMKANKLLKRTYNFTRVQGGVFQRTDMFCAN